MSDPIFPHYLTVPWKARYVREKKLDECFVCQIRDYTSDSPVYEIFRNEHILIYLNLFPYQVGHLLISPQAHITTFESLSSEMIQQIFHSLQIIK